MITQYSTQLQEILLEYVNATGGSCKQCFCGFDKELAELPGDYDPSKEGNDCQYNIVQSKSKFM